jgi:HlyD family secretion protein
MRRALIVLLVIVVVAGASWVSHGRLGKARAAKAPDYETINISRGNITSTVSATGSVLPERSANLAFQGTGIIQKVLVKQGDTVSAGQLLAELDTRDLDLAVRQAQVSVRTAEAQLQQLQDPANPVDLAAARAQLASAQAGYDKVAQGPSATDLAAAQAAVASAEAAYEAASKTGATSSSQLIASSTTLQKAQAALQQAQANYDRVAGSPNVAMLPQSLQLQQATSDYQQARANYDALSQTSGSDTQSKIQSATAQLAQARANLAKLTANAPEVAAAQAALDQARASLDKLLRGPSRAQLDVSQASVDNAKLSLEQAQRRLENARLIAPWAGVVTAVDAVEGTLPQAGQPAVELGDVSLYHINVKVDEADVASIAEGQPVSIELDAFPNRKLIGHVAKIAPSADNAAGGVISYAVRIDIDPSDLQLRGGMSATATITSSVRNDVLLIPNRAIQVDRESGKTYVERLAGDVPVRVEVRLGLRDDQQSEVRDGLAGDDRIVIRQVSSLNRLQQSMGNGQ